MKSLTLALSLLLSLTFAPQAQAQRLSLPAAATPCILKEFKSMDYLISFDAGRYSEFASTQYEGKAYYLIGVFPKGVSFFHHMVVIVDREGKCAVPYFNPHGEFESFSPRIPDLVAQEFAYQMISKHIAELGGVKQYQQELIQLARTSGGKINVTPEEAAAIQRAGVRLPPNVKFNYPQKYQ